MSIERPIVFQNKGEQLVGMLHKPEDGGKRPGIIFYHGFTGHKQEPHRLFVKMARRFAQAGFYALRFDFRGSGDSQGNFKDMTISGEISDALAGLEWFKNNTEVDSDKIAVLGLSLGGCVASYVSAEADIQALILWSAVAELLPLYEKKGPLSLMIEQAREKGYMDMKGWQLGLPLLKEIPEVDPLSKIKEFAGPILCIHGDEDTVVPVEQAYLYDKNISSDDKELFIIEGADHTFNNNKWENKVFDKTLSWIEARLK